MKVSSYHTKKELVDRVQSIVELYKRKLLLNDLPDTLGIKYNISK